MPELGDDAEEALALEEGMTDEIGDQEDEPTYEVLAPTLRAWTSTDRDPRDVGARRRCRPCQLPHPCALHTAPPPIVSFSRPLHSPCDTRPNRSSSTSCTTRPTGSRVARSCCSAWSTRTSHSAKVSPPHPALSLSLFPIDYSLFAARFGAFRYSLFAERKRLGGASFAFSAWRLNFSV